MNLNDLHAKGFSVQADGSWTKTKSNPVGAVEIDHGKRPPRPALEPAPHVHQKRTRRVVIVVTIVSFRRRELDSDNLSGSFKPLRDAIARSLGLDDGDKRFVWEYRQVETKGEQGSLVRIALKP